MKVSSFRIRRLVPGRKTRVAIGAAGAGVLLIALARAALVGRRRPPTEGEHRTRRPLLVAVPDPVTDPADHAESEARGDGGVAGSADRSGRLPGAGEGAV